MATHKHTAVYRDNPLLRDMASKDLVRCLRLQFGAMKDDDGVPKVVILMDAPDERIYFHAIPEAGIQAAIDGLTAIRKMMREQPEMFDVTGSG